MQFGKLKPAFLAVALAGAMAVQAGESGRRECPGFGVQSQEQLDTWRANLEAKNASAPISSSPQATDHRPRTLFFTGKPYDADQDAYLFKYRAYDPNAARWTSADPSGFPDGANNWVYGNNRSTFVLDSNGLWVTMVHNAINNTFFAESGVSAVWHGSTIHVAADLRSGSNDVDSVTNQLVGPCYQHAMWSPSESYEMAVTGYNQFIATEVQLARTESDRARSGHWYGINTFDIDGALNHLGRAMHAFSDNFAPSHTGFQIWNPPDMLLHPVEFWDYVSEHRSHEQMEQYTPMKAQVMISLLNQFKNDLIYIMKE